MIMEDHFVLGRGMWVMVAVIYGILLVIALALVIDLATNPDEGGVIFGALWVGALLVAGWSIFLRMPRRVVVVDGGLKFVAPSRTVLIPWCSLLSVSSPHTDINRQSLRWRWNGRTLRTWGPYDGRGVRSG
jgi:hypothetical protein